MEVSDQIDMLPGIRALNPIVGDVWRRKRYWGALVPSEEARNVVTVDRGPTVETTRLHWNCALGGPVGRTASLSSWRRWVRGTDGYAGDVSMILEVDGRDTAPTRRQVYDMARRLAEAGFGEQAEELCFCANRIWELVKPARVRFLLDEAEAVLR